MISVNPESKITQTLLMAVISVMLMPTMMCSSCSLSCSTPCLPSVRQENITTVVVDWAHMWPGLAMECVKEIRVAVNGVLHPANEEDQNRESLQLSVLPCVKYEIEVIAELFNRESDKVDHTGPPDPDGTASTLFWTLPERGTPVIISNFSVQPSLDSLHLRWVTNLPCLSRYVARVCTVLPPVTCKASIVSRDRERSTGWIMTEITNLAPCTQYTVEIAAGPHIHGDLQDYGEYSSKEEEELLEETISKHWTTEDTAFRAFVSTSTDILPVSNLSIATTANKVTANWNKLKCVDHYIMKII